jgi:hypothetical protein
LGAGGFVVVPVESGGVTGGAGAADFTQPIKKRDTARTDPVRIGNSFFIQLFGFENKIPTFFKIS